MEGERQRQSSWVIKATCRPVVLLHVLLPGLGRGRVEYLGSAQIFYSPSAQARQQDVKENYRSADNLKEYEVYSNVLLGR